MNKGGRPISSGSKADAEGGVRAYLHIARLKRVAEGLQGKDRDFVLLAADVMDALAKKNQKLGRKLGARMGRSEINQRGASFPKREAAQAIAELAADGKITAYIGRNPRRIRVVRNGRLPRGAKLIGTYDEGADFRQIAEDIAA